MVIFPDNCVEFASNSQLLRTQIRLVLRKNPSLEKELKLKTNKFKALANFLSRVEVNKKPACYLQAGFLIAKGYL